MWVDDMIDGPFTHPTYLPSYCDGGDALSLSIIRRVRINIADSGEQLCSSSRRQHWRVP